MVAGRTLWAPAGTRNESLVLVEVNGRQSRATRPVDDGKARVARAVTLSYPGGYGVPTTGPEISQAPSALDQVACIANEPVANETSDAPPGPPTPFHAHFAAVS